MPSLDMVFYQFQRVVAGATTEHARFFSSISMSIGLLVLAVVPPLLFKFGAGGIIGVCSVVVKSWVSICCMPAIFPKGRGLAFLHLARAWYFGAVGVVVRAVDQMFQIIFYVKD